MSDNGEEGIQYKCEYLDKDEIEEFNWLPRAGKAKITYQDGCTYEGTFDQNRLKTGKSTYKWFKVEEEETVVLAEYEGNYKDGAKSGIGKMKFPNGDEYTGEWSNNLQNGEGTCVYKKGKDIYSGTWVGGVKHGYGTYQFGIDDSMLQGEWKDGKFTSGKWIMKDGTFYEGSFSDGRPFGEGVYNFSNGIVQKGEYVFKDRGIEDEEKILTWKGENVVQI